jgi:glycosyltransferase involved in cell wall biosynthesis
LSATATSVRPLPERHIVASHGGCPRVSLGLPVYNGDRYLAAALDSLLAQTWTDFELIICDNASTDGTEALCRAYAQRDSRIRYVRDGQNSGAVRNHNWAAELARGEYFKWTAHDDIYAPEFLARCVAHLDANPDVVLVYSRSRFIDETGAPMHEYVHPLNLGSPDIAERFLGFVCGTHIMVEDYGLMRRAVLERTPRYGNYVWSDMTLFGELALHGPFYEVPEVLFLRREHPARAMRVNKDALSLSLFNDPRKSGGSVCPTWRVLRGHLASLYRAPLSLSQRLRLGVGVFKRGYWSHRLLPEIRSALTVARLLK